MTAPADNCLRVNHLKTELALARGHLNLIGRHPLPFETKRARRRPLEGSDELVHLEPRPVVVGELNEHLEPLELLVVHPLEKRVMLCCENLLSLGSVWELAFHPLDARFRDAIDVAVDRGLVVAHD